MVSFAMYHANFWVQALTASDDALLVGVWDDDPARGQAAAEQYGTEFWPSLEKLLAACDAITITSETAHHATYVEAAAAHGCHVLCEKPIATTMADCDRIEAAVTRSGITYMQSYPKRFDPVNSELKRLVDDGSLGRITFMRVRHGHYYGLMSGDQHSGWPLDPVLSGGGALLDEGCHGADLIRWILGEPSAVTAVISSSALGHAVEDLGAALFSYDDGRIAELASSITFAAGENSVEVWGTNGAALISGVDLASRDLTKGGYLKVSLLTDETREDPTKRKWTVSEVVPRFQTTPQFHQQNPLRFLEALTTGKPAPNTIEDGRRSLQMILSAYEAARTGRSVRIP